MPPAAPRALVLGGGLTALGTLRALARGGVASRCSADRGDFIARSRWYHPVQGSLAAATLAGDLAASHYDGSVLIPCADDYAIAVARLPEALRRRFPTATAPADVLERLTDKGTLGALLAAEGLPHPDTWLVHGPADLDPVPPAAWAHAFLKPRDSFGFFATHGVKAVRVSSREQAERFLATFGAAQPMVLQAYIPGSAAEHCFVDGFVDRQGRMAGLMARRRLRMFPLDFGNSTYLRSVALSEVGDAVASVERLVAVAGYRGPFSVELKRDPRDAVHKILEINVRPWWYVEFAARCGVNVPLLMVEDALGRSLPPAGPFRTGRTLVYPYYDVSACLELRRRGELTLGAWLGSWLRAENPIASWGDPLPGVVRFVTWLAGFLRRRLSGRGAAARGGA